MPDGVDDEQPLQVLCVGDSPSVCSHHNVVGSQPRFDRQVSRDNMRDPQPATRRRARDTEVAATDSTITHQCADDSASCGVDRRWSPNPIPATAVLMPTTRPSASASAPPLLPGLSAASVWITSSMIADVGAVPGRQRPAQRRHDARCHGAGKAQRVADRNNKLTDAQVISITKLDGGWRASARRADSARSDSGSTPMTSAGVDESSSNESVSSFAPSTTCAEVNRVTIGAEDDR